MSALSEIIQESVMLAVLDGEQVRYVGRAKVEGEFHLAALAYNLKKAARLAL